MAEQCVERPRVKGMNWPTYHPCQKPAKVERDGKWYCGTHDPEKVAARREARAAKWDADFNRKLRLWARQAIEREVVTLAREWRKSHHGEDFCPESCEHLDCALARKVDELEASHE